MKNHSSQSILPYRNSRWYGGGTVGYYIHKKAAKYLIQHIHKNGIDKPIDLYLYSQHWKIKIGIVRIPIINHDYGTPSCIR